jgi:hypothetical protein
MNLELNSSWRTMNVRYLAVTLSVSVLTACGGSTETPDAPTPPTTVPATTPPATTPPRATFSCPLPASSNPSNNCFIGTAQLGSQVNSAIDTLIATRPELFNLNDLAGSNPRVVDRDRYHQALKEELEKRSVCVIVEKEEIAIKNANSYSEQWNAWTTAGYVRRKYVTTCTPAWF